MSKTIILFGPGFVGSLIAELAPKSGFEIITASRSGENSDEIADLTDLNSLTALEAKYKPDCIIHCASADRAKDAKKRIKNYRKVYLTGAENICSAFPETKKLFTSSTSVYAQTDGSTVTEVSPTQPSSETAKILLQAEAIILQNLGTVARLSGIYGEGRSYLIDYLKRGEATLPNEENDRILNHIHARDAASACLHLLRKNVGIYNVSDSAHHTYSETLSILSSKLDLPLKPSTGEAIPSSRAYTNKTVSNKKIIASGWQPRYPDFIETISSNSI